VGLIEAADGGTLFLDEIGELELQLQAKLLRVLENFRVRPIGSVSDRRVNVRIVAATNRDLAREAQAGRFRSDLVYRLSVFQIRIPPLRERGDDALLLAQEFLQRLANRYGRPTLRLQPAALAALRNYPWPGNVRELRNCLERAVLMQRGPDLSPDDLALPARDALMPVPQLQLQAHTASPSLAQLAGGPISGFGALSGPAPLAPAHGGSGVASLDAVERQHLLQALETHGWNVSLAARALQVTRDTMRYRMAKHGLHRQAER
jgi:DNA-binding NtrC family response regulator